MNQIIEIKKLLRFDASNPNDSILIWGDTYGCIHNIHFNSTAIALFERPSVNVNAMKSSDKSANG